MSLMTDIERALYGQTLIEMDDQEILDERLERVNAMLQANVDAVNAKNQPTAPEVIEALDEDAKRALQYVAMVNSEINHRQEEAQEETQHQQATKEAQEAALNVARAAALENMIERARDLTDLMTTIRSMMLQLAGDLPTEGRYSPVTWGYKPVVAGAQDAAKSLVEAWGMTQDAQHRLEMVVRQINHMQQRFEHGMTGADPDELENQDDLPF